MTLRTNAFHLFTGLGAIGMTALLGLPTSRPTAHRPAPAAVDWVTTQSITPLMPPAPLTLGQDAASTGNALSAIDGAATPGESHPSAGQLVAAYAPEGIDPAGNPILRAPPSVRTDLDGLREAISAYRSGDLAKGDTEAARIPDPLARLAVEWVALQTQPRAAGFQRISAFLSDHPDWPARAGLQKRLEELLYLDKGRPALASAWFAGRAPQTAQGKIALARARMADGKTEPARVLVTEVWRREDVTKWLEGQILKEFGSLLTKDDHRARATALTYQGHAAAALRAAALAGDDVTALVKARLAVDKEQSSDKLMQAVPAPLQTDPMYLLSNIQRLRRAGKLDEAAKAMFEAPRDRAVLGNADEWWTERRILARKLLDAKNPKDAYRLCAEHAATGREATIEAEFHAGWIALRFLEDPALAGRHFDAAAKQAATPISRARAAYWQGRAAEARADREAALAFYRTAAENPIAYYGQLASARLGARAVALRQPHDIARGDARAAPVRVVELLQALEQNDLAQALAVETTRSLDDEAQVAALADVVARSGDARATLTIGKLATQRGQFLDEVAFPTFGIPAFLPLGGSAALPIVYSIARQESAFAPAVVSQAGAKGLMQMIDSTARRTAQQMGVPFDKSRMTQDPAFNAQLGAAHLGQLLGEYRGSYILTFAAYNAGGKRVKEWIEAYGDPRDPAVDPVDWVEHIPFTETRNYVQRVVENLEMYKIRFGETRAFAIEADLRGAQAKL